MDSMIDLMGLGGLNYPQTFRCSDLILPYVRRFLGLVNQVSTRDVDM